MYAQNPRENVSPKQKIPATILLVFSLAGLVAGFAFGGFTGHKAPPTTSNIGPKKTPTTIVRSTVTVTPDPTPENITPGYPQFSPFPAPTESATSGTEYTVGMQVFDKQATPQPIHSPDVTCRVWLVKQIPSGQKLSIDDKTLATVSNLTAPIQGTINGQPDPEIAGGLVFDSTTPQTALCNASGQMTWKYKIAPTVTAGTYDMVLLADWEGKHYNWYWTEITIQ